MRRTGEEMIQGGEVELTEDVEWERYEVFVEGATFCPPY